MSYPRKFPAVESLAEFQPGATSFIKNNQSEAGRAGMPRQLNVPVVE
jgi:hypothetical protein